MHTRKLSAEIAVVCWLFKRLSNTLVYLRERPAQTIVRAATLRQNLQIKLATSPSHSILTLGRPIPALTLYRQAPGRAATRVPMFKSPVWLDPNKSPWESKFDLPLWRRAPC